MEEKKSFSKAVETLKTNTAKVEQNYKQMKSELSDKSQLLDQLKAERDALQVRRSRVLAENILLQHQLNSLE